MILPAGQFKDFENLISRNKTVLIGCLSFEERCKNVPIKIITMRNQARVVLFKIDDPLDAFPNYRSIIDVKIDRNREALDALNGSVMEVPCNLLDTEDDMSRHLRRCEDGEDALYILDISCFPKRYFCYLLKQLLRYEWCQTLLVTYTTPAPNGYTDQHLTADSMPWDNLPGFASASHLGGNTLVVSLGFEVLNIFSILDVYRGKSSPKVLMSFPSSALFIKRQWDMLRQMFSQAQFHVLEKDIVAVSYWDVEEVFNRLHYWQSDAAGRLALAPFGTKPHSLGMALYAMQSGSGMYYTQPKSYNPEYSRGIGETWGYLVKYKGTACYDRQKKS